MQHHRPLTVTHAVGEADLQACLALRRTRFRAGATSDADRFDPVSEHLMIRDAAGLAATLRYRLLPDGGAAAAGYSGQFYDLSRFARIAAPVLEIGRLCVRDAGAEPAVLRLVWGTLTAIADAAGVALVFGCTSFPGHPVPRALFAHLAAVAPAPKDLAPGRGGHEVVALASDGGGGAGMPPQMPPLLRSYLALGAWVSDHAVIDRDLGTLHVLTALETARVPPARARVLRAIAGALP